MKNSVSEKFVTKWWSGSNAALGLDLEEWIEKSYQDPDLFWKEIIFAEQENILPASESILGKNYNFYHDCITRHLKAHSVAFSIIKNRDEIDNWSYERLHHCVNFHVEKWSYHSPQPNQLMAIVSRPGIHFLISFLTALRFGLKICYLPTNSPFLGKRRIFKILSEIKPDLIVADENSFSFETTPILHVNEQGVDEEDHNPHSFAYPAATEFLLTFSLYKQEVFKLSTLDAQTLYLHSLRDAFFTLNLLQHPFWATPLACPLRTEPFHTLTSLLCGTTRIFVSDESIQKDPTLLQDERISLVGVSNRLQQLWVESPGAPTRYLKSYYKSPLDVNYQAWKLFSQLNKLEKTPSFQVLVDNTAGGISLFSKPALEMTDFALRPTLGTQWSLNDIQGSGEPSLNGFGVFNTLHLSDRSPNNLVLTVVERNLMMTGSVEPTREGVTFPLFELEDNVRELSFIEDCMLHPIPKMGTVFSKFFVLLVFVTPMKQLFSEEDKTQWTLEITQKIKEHLGQGFLPDRIEYFPLLPKKHVFGIDRSWCAAQYSSGLLLQKRDLPHYQTLSVLKKLVQKVSLS